jgi:hypothetical protein
LGNQLSKYDKVNLQICEYFSGWTLEYVENLTIKQRQTIIIYINQIAKERERKSKNGRRK